MNNKQRKTLTAIFEKPTPKNLEWTAVASLIQALGGQIKHNQGSKVRIELNHISLNIHSPHPQKEVKHYVICLLKEFLENAGVTP